MKVFGRDLLEKVVDLARRNDSLLRLADLLQKVSMTLP